MSQKDVRKNLTPLERQLFDFIAKQCKGDPDKYVEEESLYAWIKGKPNWTSAILKGVLCRLKSLAILLKFPKGIRPVTHL